MISETVQSCDDRQKNYRSALLYVYRFWTSVLTVHQHFGNAQVQAVSFVVFAFVYNVSFDNFSNLKFLKLPAIPDHLIACENVHDLWDGLQVSATGMLMAENDVTCLQDELRALIQTV